jgi:hypothetical protein
MTGGNTTGIERGGSMLNGIPPIGTTDARYVAARRLQANEREGTFSVSTASGPPPEVLDALDGAARVHDELRSAGLSVSFDVQAAGNVRVRVTDGSGNVVHDLQPAHALQLLGSQGAVDELAQ